jgi:uncharacterized membrane protein YtjA (UPF0391 family)
MMGLGSALGALLSPVVLQLFTGQFLTLALLFFVLAIVAAIVGASGVAGISMDIAKWMVIIFVVLAIASLIL